MGAGWVLFKDPCCLHLPYLILFDYPQRSFDGDTAKRQGGGSDRGGGEGFLGEVGEKASEDGELDLMMVGGEEGKGRRFDVGAKGRSREKISVSIRQKGVDGEVV